MIIFFNKKTQEIVGHIGDRVHPKEVLEGAKISMSNIPDRDIGKLIIPFKNNYKAVVVPKVESRVVDKETMRVEKIVVGKKKVKRAFDMIPDVPFVDKILEFEKDTSSIYKHKVQLDKSGRVIGFVKK